MSSIAITTHLVSVKEAATILGIKKKTLEIWRSTQRYFIPYVKIGSSVKYDVKDIEAFIEKNKVQTQEDNFNFL